jgi:predicted RNase H-like HicB family nuclease
MEASYTAVVQQRGPWWVGWIEEIPGVNSQGESREELLDNLRSALDEALEMNRADALAAAQGAPYRADWCLYYHHDGVLTFARDPDFARVRW